MSEGGATRHVEVEVFRILVGAEIREHPHRPVFPLDVNSDGANDVHDGGDDGRVCVAEVGERRNVALRYDDDVDRPERSCVMEGENLVGLDDDVHRRSSAECFVAVEVAHVGSDDS